MPSTYHSLHAHIIFSTKGRSPFMTESIRPRIFQFMGGVLKGLGATPINIGGMPDHVHVLLGYRPEQAISSLVRELKKATTNWVREELHVRGFAWQEGYAALTVGTEINVISRYIDRQAEHHRVQTSLAEYVEILRRMGLEFDPKYLH